MPFETIPLNDGNKIPSIAYGTGSKWKGQDVTKYVEQAIDVGFWHLDTAAYYQTEGGVGAAIRESGLARSDLYITTKYFTGDVEASVIHSLKELRLSFVDLYLIHTPRAELDISAIWEDFQLMKKKGYVKSVGVSNFTIEHLEILAKTSSVRPAVNQIQLDPYNYKANIPLLKYCSAHGIIVEAYSSLAPVTRYPGGPVDAALQAAATRRGATLTQIILLWVKSKGIVIVTTSSTKEHLQEFLASADLEPLTVEEIASIEEASSHGSPTVASNRAVVFLVPLLALLLTAYFLISFHRCM